MLKVFGSEPGYMDLIKPDMWKYYSSIMMSICETNYEKSTIHIDDLDTPDISGGYGVSRGSVLFKDGRVFAVPSETDTTTITNVDDTVSEYGSYLMTPYYDHFKSGTLAADGKVYCNGSSFAGFLITDGYNDVLHYNTEYPNLPGNYNYCSFSLVPGTNKLFSNVNQYSYLYDIYKDSFEFIYTGVTTTMLNFLAPDGIIYSYAGYSGNTKLFGIDPKTCTHVYTFDFETIWGHSEYQAACSVMTPDGMVYIFMKECPYLYKFDSINRQMSIAYNFGWNASFFGACLTLDGRIIAMPGWNGSGCYMVLDWLSGTDSVTFPTLTGYINVVSGGTMRFDGSIIFVRHSAGSYPENIKVSFDNIKIPSREFMKCAYINRY